MKGPRPLKQGSRKFALKMMLVGLAMSAAGACFMILLLKQGNTYDDFHQYEVIRNGVPTGEILSAHEAYARDSLFFGTTAVFFGGLGGLMTVLSALIYDRGKVTMAAFGGLVLIGAGAAGYVLYKPAKSTKVTSSTQPVTASEMGVAFYPGAESKTNTHMNVAGKNILTANFLTSDSKDQVVAFYQSKLGPDAKTSTSTNVEAFMLDKGTGETVLVTVSQSQSELGGKTQIVITHAKAVAPATTQ